MSALLAACKPLILLDFHRSFNDTPTRSSTQVGTRFFMPGKSPSPLRGRYPFYLPQGWRDSPQGASPSLLSISPFWKHGIPPVRAQKAALLWESRFLTGLALRPLMGAFLC